MLKFLHALKPAGNISNDCLGLANGEELEVHFIYKVLPNRFSMWLYHFLFPLIIRERCSCFMLFRALGFGSFEKPFFKFEFKNICKF